MVSTYIEDHKKIVGQISNVKVFTVDPYFKVIFSPDTHKVLKLAHLGILDILGGSVGPETIPTSKYSGSWTIIPKVMIFGPPGAPQYFFRKNPGFLIIGHLIISIANLWTNLTFLATEITRRDHQGGLT